MQVIPPFSWHFIYPFRYALYMSLHIKKINHQFSVLKKPELSGFFHAPGYYSRRRYFQTRQYRRVIARLCRAFFMHFQVRLRSSKFQANDCPVMSGFFHAQIVGFSCSISCDCPVCRAFFMHRYSRCRYEERTSLVIARLCRAFFMHVSPESRTVNLLCDCPVM